MISEVELESKIFFGNRLKTYLNTTQFAYANLNYSYVGCKEGRTKRNV